MIVHNCPQRSAEWHRLRLGIPTASEFGKIVTPTGKPSKQREGLMYRLLAEWATGAPLESVNTEWMQRGTDLEADARAAYEFLSGNGVEQVGFVTNDARTIGCSPDSLIYEDGRIVGGLELKCPAPQTHIGYVLGATVAEDCVPQVQGCIWLCEVDWWDIVSYYPGMPASILRVERNEQYLSALIPALDQFVDELAAARERLIALGLEPKRTPEPQPDKYGFDVSEDDARKIWEATQCKA